MHQKEDLINLGKVSSVYGIKGWVKVYSYTDPMDQILDYQDWILEQDGKYRTVTVEAGRSHGKGMVAHIQGYNDREQAALLQGSLIYVYRDQLPDLEAGDYYWFQLVGLRVVTQDGHDLGKIQNMMSAGSANDVMIIKGDSQSIDQTERLVPYLLEKVVLDIDLEAKLVKVDWEPDY